MPTLSYSPFLPALLTTLKSGSVEQVRDLFRGPLDKSQSVAAMRWLRAHRKAVSDQVLCLLNDFWWHQTEDSAQTAGKWFISVPADACRDLPDIPVFDTPEALCAKVVETLSLEDAFFCRQPALV